MPPLKRRQVRWARRWMTLVLLGLFVFMLGINPGMIGMDRSPVVGFVQIGVWLTGLALLRLGASLTVRVGATLAQQALHADTLAGLQAEFEAAFHPASFADFL